MQLNEDGVHYVCASTFLHISWPLPATEVSGTDRTDSNDSKMMMRYVPLRNRPCVLDFRLAITPQRYTHCTNAQVLMVSVLQCVPIANKSVWSIELLFTPSYMQEVIDSQQEGLFKMNERTPTSLCPRQSTHRTSDSACQTMDRSSCS